MATIHAYDLSTDSPIDRFKFLNRIEDRFEGGIDYVTSGRNTVGILFRNIIGDFPVRNLAPDGSLTDNGYDQKEVMARINWVVTRKIPLSMDRRMGRTQKCQLFTARF